MARWFNTSDPCEADIHYMLPPTVRLPSLERLIRQRSYFVIHAPRQTGKTTAMLALAKQLTESGDYTAALVSVELGAPFSHDPPMAEVTILDSWQASTKFDLPEDLRPPLYLGYWTARTKNSSSFTGLGTSISKTISIIY